MLNMTNVNFSDFFLSHSAKMLIIDPGTGSILDANPPALKFYGYTLQEIKKLKIYDINQLSESEIKQKMSSALDKTRKQFISPHKLKDGRIRFVKVFSSSFTQNNSKYLLSIIEDITESYNEDDLIRKEMEIFNYGPVASIIWEQSEGWPVIYVSENIKSVLGYDTSFFTGKDFRYVSIIHPDDLERVADEVKYFTDRGVDNFNQEYRLLKSDGSYIWIYDVTKFVRDLSGKIIEIRGYFFDNTDKKNLEQQLITNSETLNYIIDAAELGTWQWNIKTGDVIFNEKWARMIGYTLEELEPISIKTWQELCHPDDLRKSDLLIEKHLSGDKEFYECEIRVKCKNGTYKWILVKGKIIKRDKKGNPEMLFGVNIDIDYIKRLQVKVSKYLDYLNRAQKVSKIGSWHLNIPKDHLWWSKQTYEMFGVKYNTPMNVENFLKYVHPEDVDFVMSSWGEALKGETYDIEHRIVVNNETKWVNEKAEIIFDAEGNPLEGIGTVQDITERKHLEDKLRKENAIITSIFNMMPGYLWQIDKSRTIIRQNRNALEHFGDNIGEKCYMAIFCGKFLDANNKNGLDSSLPKEIGCTFCLGDESLQQKTSFNIEIEDNNKVYNVWWVPINSNEYLHYMIDITDQKETEMLLRNLSVTDFLTQYYNRRYFTEKLEREIDLARRAGRCFSVLMFDIDHFKNINDNYGHDVGDTVLVAVASLVRKRIRKVDIPCRWGGEEFMILLPETNLKNAHKLAEELRELISCQKIDEKISVTASFGVTECQKTDTVLSIAKRADELMYKAKSLGRNRVVSG